MSIPNTAKRTVRPTHPGEMLREDFMPDCGLTVAGLADDLGVSRQTVNELLRERQDIERPSRLPRASGGNAGTLA